MSAGPKRTLARAKRGKAVKLTRATAKFGKDAIVFIGYAALFGGEGIDDCLLVAGSIEALRRLWKERIPKCYSALDESMVRHVAMVQMKSIKVVVPPEERR